MKEINVIDLNFKPRVYECYEVETQCNTVKEFQESDSEDDIEYIPVERKDSNIRYVKMRINFRVSCRTVLVIKGKLMP